jgi:hypothetical protein
MVVLNSRLVLGVTLLLMAGCGLLGKKRIDTPPPVSVHPSEQIPLPTPDKAVSAGTNTEPKQLAMVSNLRESKPVSPTSLIPPPPEMSFPAIPPPPPKDYPNEPLAPEPQRKDTVPAEKNLFEPAILQASATRPAANSDQMVKPAEATAPIVKRAVAPAAAEPEVPTSVTETNLDAVRRLYKTSVERMGKLDGFEARLTRREVINNRPQPEEVMQYHFRQAPFSVHMKWIGKEGTGRELAYCQGKFDDKVNILTAKGDGAIIVPAGLQKAYDAEDSTIRSRSRYDFREAGMGLSLKWIGKVLQEMERTNDTKRLRYLGKVSRPERKQGLEGIEETIPPGWEPLLPRGGKRLTFFDCDPNSPSFGLPILVMAYADNRREVEYYFFDQLRPTNFSDSDFDPRRLWRR